MTAQPHEDPRVTRARGVVAVDTDVYGELLDTDPIRLRDVAISHHGVIEDLLAYIDEERS